jgi:hypothetical protein
VRLRVRLAVLSVTALSTAGVAALPSVTAHDVARAAACQSQPNSVHVALSASKYPETTDHISDAIAAGQPSLLHIDRADEDAHRAAGATMGNALEGWCEGQPFRIDIVP